MLSVEQLREATERRNLIDVLMSKEGSADFVLRNGKVINVLTREIYKADVAVKGKYILKVGDASDVIGKTTQVIDLKEKYYVAPGFIDSHMHFESAMLTATEFSRISIPTGTTTLISDPHEIGNVLGPMGIKAMAEECALLPNHVYLRVPALTPDSPGLETAGYDITSKDIPEMLGYKHVTGIGETQGVTATKFVYKYTPEVFNDTIASTLYAGSIGDRVDGNAAEIFGSDLAAHIIAGGGDISCHETTTKKEAIEKLRYGVYVLMREGSTQRNMEECIKALTEDRLDSRRLILATDDMLAEDIEKYGHMDEIIRRVIKTGVDPVEAIQMATINAATWHRLDDIGYLAPSKLADIVVLSDLENVRVKSVYLGGKHVAEDKKLLISIPAYTYPDSVKDSVHRAAIKAEDLMIRASGSEVKTRVIELIEFQNLTGQKVHNLPVENGYVQPSPEDDVIPIVVVGRHSHDASIGRSFVTGFKMNAGAMAESVSHDTHNIIAAGTNYEDMAVAINRVIEMQGGLSIAKQGKILGELGLPIAGLMTDQLTGPELSAKMAMLTKVAEEKLGTKIWGPFMHLSFLSLSTSPTWKITDRGLIDVNNHKILEPIEK
jgi:adenine deaminase